MIGKVYRMTSTTSRHRKKARINKEKLLAGWCFHRYEGASSQVQGARLDTETHKLRVPAAIASWAAAQQEQLQKLRVLIPAEMNHLALGKGTPNTKDSILLE